MTGTNFKSSAVGCGGMGGVPKAGRDGVAIELKVDCAKNLSVEQFVKRKLLNAKNMKIK